MEVKYNSSQLSRGKRAPADGPQMSDDWLMGETTKYDRIREAVNDDRVIAQSIKDGLENEATLKLLANVSPDGTVKYIVIDSKGDKTDNELP